MIRRLREVQQEFVVERVPVFHQYQSTATRHGHIETDRAAMAFNFAREIPPLLPLNPKDKPTVFFTGIGDAGALVARSLDPPAPTLFD